MPITVAFVGSRDYPNLELVRKHVRALARKYPDAVVVSGGCRGVDLAAETEAKRCGLAWVSYRPTKSNAQPGRYHITVHRPEGISMDEDESYHDSFGRAAFYRNGLIVRAADRVMAYPTRPGRGTRDSMSKAEALGRPVHAYELA